MSIDIATYCFLSYTNLKVMTAARLWIQPVEVFHKVWFKCVCVCVFFLFLLFFDKLSRWWFHFFIFTPTWGRFPF